MIDLYLRASDEAALAAALPFARRDDAWTEVGEGFALDVIGSIVLTNGTYDDDGTELTPPVIDERYHANLRCTEDVAALVPTGLIVTPSSPVRVWA